MLIYDKLKWIQKSCELSFIFLLHLFYVLEQLFYITNERSHFFEKKKRKRTIL